MKKYNGTIILDIDDTLAPLSPLLCKTLNEHTGECISCEDWNSFTITDIYKNLKIQDFYNIIIENQLLSRILPYNGVKEIIDHLNKNYRLVCISSRAYHPDAYEITRQWLHDYKLEVHELWISGNGIKKSKYVNYYIDNILVVDDNLDNCIDIKHNCDEMKILIKDQPWNRNDNNFIRIDNLSEVLTYL